MYAEDELLPISALQHLLFCERQCALIHIEGLWAENRLTVEGRHLHDKAHGGDAGPRGGGLVEHRTGDAGGSVRICRGMRLQSMRLGLTGVADIVEMHACDDGRPLDTPRPMPVEYKRGKPKRDHSDHVQLCAQALCLEEMTGADVPVGAMFYGRPRRRQEVVFDAVLRARTEQAARRLHQMIASGVTPTAPKMPKCRNCSLRDLCMPDATHQRSASAYLKRSVKLVVAGDVTEEVDP